MSFINSIQGITTFINCVLRCGIEKIDLSEGKTDADRLNTELTSWRLQTWPELQNTDIKHLAEVFVH